MQLASQEGPGGAKVACLAAFTRICSLAEVADSA